LNHGISSPCTLLWIHFSLSLHPHCRRKVLASSPARTSAHAAIRQDVDRPWRWPCTPSNGKHSASCDGTKACSA
jgi:hypothetical protein